MCGVCTQPCESTSECTTLDASAECYARGSLGQRLLCASPESAPSVCLSGCASDSSCALGLECRIGLCVPPDLSFQTLETPRETAEPIAAPVPREEEKSEPELPLSVEPELDVAPVIQECIATTGKQQPYACVCPSELLDCPSFEEALTANRGQEVWRDCGLLSVRYFHTFGSQQYYYEEETRSPVGLRIYTDVIGGETLAEDYSLSCDSEQFVCARCGVSRPSCANEAALLPELQ